MAATPEPVGSAARYGGAAASGPVPLRIHAGDVELVADAYGEPGDPPVVLLHGGGQTRHSWGSTARTLADSGWYVLNVDQRGHGDSGWSPDGDYRLDRFASDVTDVVRSLGRPPVLVGASLGGNAALAALGAHPDLALGLVLVDVSPFLQREGLDRIRGFMTAKAQEGFADLDEAADAVAGYLPQRRRRNPEGLRKNLRLRDGRWYWHWDPAFLGTAAGAARLRVDPERLSAAAERLRHPTLLMRGARSDVLALEDCARFLELVPHAEFADVAGARHMVAGDDNATFGEALHGFLRRRVASRLRVVAAPDSPVNRR